MSPRQTRGFTFVELLIMAAIIAILAATVAPNFLGAKSRAKIARCKNDLRTIAVGLESYKLDNKHYPYPAIYSKDGMAGLSLPYVYELSTPIAYLASVDYRDPFRPKNPWYHYSAWPLWSVAGQIELPIGYINYNGFWASLYTLDKKHDGFILKEYGPDRWPQWAEWGWVQSIGQSPARWTGSFSNLCWPYIYDPTNGAVSTGDICRFGGALPGAPAQ